MSAAARDTWVHLHMARAGITAARQWDEIAKHPGMYHAAALSDLCASRGLGPSSGCGLALSDFQAPGFMPMPMECDSEGGEAD